MATQTLYTRDNPYVGRLLSRERVTPSTCEKRTYHMALDIRGSGITYSAGDCVAILPDNLPEAVETALARFGGDRMITDPRRGDTLSLRDFLTTRANLDDEAQTPEKLRRLLPRFYSIASFSPDEIHILVRQTGLCTDFLCNRATDVPFYIQPGRHFSLPEDPNTPIIMIGAGTGVAPYRAFLQQRRAQNASGDHWLFFGEWTESGHFFYREDWNDIRLTTAFSRDQPEKIYVQNRLLEHGDELARWIDSGAYLYVCGDAKEMAPAVEAALLQILPSADALKTMRREKRYRRDIY